MSLPYEVEGKKSATPDPQVVLENLTKQLGMLEKRQEHQENQAAKYKQDAVNFAAKARQALKTSVAYAVQARKTAGMAENLRSMQMIISSQMATNDTVKVMSEADELTKQSLKEDQVEERVDDILEHMEEVVDDLREHMAEHARVQHALGASREPVVDEGKLGAEPYSELRALLARTRSDEDEIANLMARFG
jgi:hypothetical protein